MSLVYSYSGTAVDTSVNLKKRTNYSQPITLFVTGTSVAVDAVKVQIKNVDGLYVSMQGTEFGEGYNQINIPTGVEYKVDVDNGGVNAIVVDVYA